jgi:DNA-binding response OmpR family regulator
MLPGSVMRWRLRWNGGIWAPIEAPPAARATMLDAREGFNEGIDQVSELLRLLVNHRGQTVSRDTILARVWKEQPFITPRTVDVHIA